MALWKSIEGTMQLELTSADPAGLLTAIHAAGITIFKVESVDEISLKLRIYQRDYAKLQMLVAKRGERLIIKRKIGAFWVGNRAKQRPLFALFLILLLTLALYLPSRIFFVNVEGNVTVPANQIIDEAARCGVCFGVSRRSIRSEIVKNALIAQIPQLQWVGVNTSGCVATIRVREKSAVTQRGNQDSNVSSIVAGRDGVICDMTVLQGNPVCKVGQVVRQGQTLVSGYTDCGIIIKATQAKAEVYAQTSHKLTVTALAKSFMRGQSVGTEKKYSLKIGKKLINFYKDSGISDSSCVKMYEEHYLTLPGGFQLPLSMICQTSIFYEDQLVSTSTDDFEWLEAFTQEYLQDHMVAGKVLTANYTLDQGIEPYFLKADFSCVEMIGQVKSEGSLQIDGKDS